MTYLNRLHTEELIDQDILASTKQVQFDYVLENRLGMYVGTNLAELPTEAEEFFVACEEALEGPNGDKMWTSIRSHLHSTGAFVISADCEYPEAALRWVDYFYSDEGILFYHYGIEGDTTVRNTSGTYSYSQEILDQMVDGVSYDEVVSNYTPFAGGSNPTIMKDPYFSGLELTPIPMEAADNLMPYIPLEIWPFFTYTAEENIVMTEIDSAIGKYCNEQTVGFITGEIPLDDAIWNAYVAEVEKLGVAQVLEVQEAAYARIK